MNEYRQFMQSPKAPKEMQDMPLDDLDCNMKRKDKAFNKFQKRVNLEPEQVFNISYKIMKFCGPNWGLCLSRILKSKG